MTSIETKPTDGTGCNYFLFVYLFVCFFRHDSEPASQSQSSSKTTGAQGHRKPEAKPENQGDVSGLGSESRRYKAMSYASEDTTE